MSINEMKLKAIEKITSVEDKSILKNILTELEKNENKKESNPLSLSQHFDYISNRYDDTLKRLAK